MLDPILNDKNSSIDSKLHALGTRQGRRDVLPIVAYMVATAAHNKEVGPDDAATCFEQYYKGVNGNVKLDFTEPTIKVQIIICARSSNAPTQGSCNGSWSYTPSCAIAATRR